MNDNEAQEILEARKKLAEKFGNTKLGGKGTQTRKKEPKHRTTAGAVDKKIQSVLKKAQAKKINEVQEVNIFKDDNTVLHFKKPNLEYSFKEKVSFLSGPHEQKKITELLPNLIKQLGPKQFGLMREYAEQLKKKDKGEGKVEEVPELVEDFEEVSKQDEKKAEEK